MTRLVSRLSDLARLQSGDLELQRGLHDSSCALRAAHDEFEPQASAQRVALSIEAAANRYAGDVWCDRERLVQVLTLLLECALRVVPEGGRITVGVVSAVDPVVQFDVTATRGPQSRALALELPKPQLVLASGLIDLHGATLAIHRDDARVSMSFALQRKGHLTSVIASLDGDGV
jgi:hypothetical protein